MPIATVLILTIGIAAAAVAGWLLGRSSLNLLRGELDRAEAAYRDVLASHPRLAAALVGIGAVHYYREQFEDAARVFREIAHAHPGFGLAHYGVTQAERRREERDRPTSGRRSLNNC